MEYAPKSYPARCRQATHTTEALAEELETEFCIHGRVVELIGAKGKLIDVYGSVEFILGNVTRRVGVGDIVELSGRKVAKELLVDEVVLLVSVERGAWKSVEAAEYSHSGRALILRARVLAAVRTFFDTREFIEVETPSLVQAAGQDLHIQLFETEFISGAEQSSYVLITSPEHHMKRLLVEGWERIYQICRCFRNGECSQVHNPEFTMVEWYRAYVDYQAIMADVEALVSHVAYSVLGTTEIEYGENSIDLSPPWQRLSLKDAFAELASLAVDSWEDEEGFRRRAQDVDSPSIGIEDSWEDVFYKLLIEKIEPALAKMGPVFLTEYPPQMAALAKLNKRNGLYAERAEAYVGGLELANGFTELNDPAEQRRRFVAEQKKRRQVGYSVHPVDEKLLKALERGMPPAAGTALGIDRLLMLLSGSSTIGTVIAFPFQEV